MGEVSWGCCCGLIRAVSLTVCTCTWLPSLLIDFLLENGWGPGCVMRSGSPSPEMIKPSTQGFMWPQPEETEIQQENILLSTMSLAKWSVIGSGILLPGYQDSMYCLAHHQVESSAKDPYLSFFLRNDFPKYPSCYHHIYHPTPSYIHLFTLKSTEPVLPHCGLEGLAVARALPSKRWPSKCSTSFFPFLGYWTSHFGSQSHISNPCHLQDYYHIYVLGCFEVYIPINNYITCKQGPVSHVVNAKTEKMGIS
jgi:hypothetical protein